MCSEVGWKHRETIKTLEEKRKVKSEAYWAKKKEMIQVRLLHLPRFPYACTLPTASSLASCVVASSLLPTAHSSEMDR